MDSSIRNSWKITNSANDGFPHVETVETVAEDRPQAFEPSMMGVFSSEPGPAGPRFGTFEKETYGGWLRNRAADRW